MATRIPLVIVAGQIQQLQVGDQIVVAAATYDARTATNAEASVALTAGMPVYISAAAAAKRAQANAMATSAVSGVWLDASTAAAGSGTYAAAGVAVCSTAQWDVVTGLTGGLVPNTNYYLDAAAAAKLTATAPSTVGQTVCMVGRALSTTDLEIYAIPPILL
jgi:hypothetical protein